MLMMYQSIQTKFITLLFRVERGFSNFCNHTKQDTNTQEKQEFICKRREIFNKPQRAYGYKLVDL